MCRGYYERLEPIDLIECPSKWKRVTKPCSRNWQTQADLIIAQNQTLCQDEHFAKSDAQQSLHQICLPRLQTFIFSATLTLDPRAQRSHLGLSKTMNGTDQMEPVGGQLSHSPHPGGEDGANKAGCCTHAGRKSSQFAARFASPLLADYQFLRKMPSSLQCVTTSARTS